jgi:hypothetical protein
MPLASSLTRNAMVAERNLLKKSRDPCASCRLPKAKKQLQRLRQQILDVRW